VTLSVALRNMATGKARVAFSVAGVAVATLLLSFVLALYRGWNDGLAAYVDQTPADVWVTAIGSDGFFTPAFISKTFVAMIQEQPGVLDAQPLLYRPVKLRSQQGAYDTWVVGFVKGGMGGPLRMAEGSATPGPREIVVDDVLARLADISVGDEVDVGGNQLKVVGISEGGNAVFAQIAFVDQDEAKAEFQAALDQAKVPAGVTTIDPKTTVNLVLVKTAPGQGPAVADTINKKVPAVAAFPSKQFSENSRRALKQAVLPILVIILALAFLVGTVVLGLTVYTLVLEKEREFGVVKAIGVPGPGLLRIVLEQALVCCILGFGAGMGATFVATWVVHQAVPQFITAFYATDIALVLGGSIVMSVLASLIPAIRVMRVDTLSVFKA
jgi:putative ABC transport system permease protein